MNKFDDQYFKLAEVIVMDAVNDYRKALKILSRHPESIRANSIKKSCELFFTSGWFNVLSTIDAEWLIEKLQKEAV